MNSVYIDSAVASSPIYIGPANANSIIIGNANSTTTIQGLPFNSFAGQPLVAYNVSTGVNANIPTGLEFGSVVENNTNQGGKAFIDFHTNQKGFVDYDARIMAAGGSTVTPATTQASLNYYAANHYFAGNVNMGTGANIGLQPTAGYVAPTAGTMLGGITSAVLSSVTLNNNQIAVGSLIVPNTGYYILSYCVRLTATSQTTITTFQTWLDQGTTPALTVSGNQCNAATQIVNNTTALPSNSSSCIALCTGGKTIILYMYTQNSGTITTEISTSYFNIVRLA